MQLEQTFSLYGAPEQVWPAFKDLDLLVGCLPGASANGEIEYNEDIASIPLRFEVRLGPIAAAFVGTGKLISDDQALSGSFEGSAVDRKTNSRVSGVAKFSLNAAEDPATGTTVKVGIDYSLAGSLAQFNRAGIVRQLADALTSEFAKRLQEKITAGQVIEPVVLDNVNANTNPEAIPKAKTATNGQTSVQAKTKPPAEPNALNPLTLVWAAVRHECSKLIAKLSGKKIP